MAILSFKRLGWLKSHREDYRQDVLLSLVARLKTLYDPEAQPIKNHEAYVVQSSLNHIRRRQRARLDDPVIKSLDSDDLDETPADARLGQEDALVASEAVKHVWSECIALMSSKQLALFLFDRNDILWQLICIRDPISLDEIAEALALTPPQLEEIMARLPCNSDRELAQLINMTEHNVHLLRNRMKPMLKRIQESCGYGEGAGVRKLLR
jgi:hypothetical protein